MTLEPSKEEPGAWINPAWQKGSPGTFAVVIGVSRYTYLDGSDASLGLGQLEVSAITAFRVFNWLVDHYYVAGCPLARCWLLLSPTSKEQAFDAAITTHLHEPTFDHCENAIGWWASHMAALPPNAAEASRGLFFFSGHGLEQVKGHQLLIPSDYLRPPNRNPNRALSTRNLSSGLATSKVPLQLFLLDACRDAPMLPTGARLTGTDVLPESGPQNSRKSYFSPILYATNSGQQAFQQRSPEQGLSLFGQALLDGLVGKPDLALKAAGTSVWVNLFPLQEFIMARVIEALEKEQAVDPQPVMLDGAYNALVTELPAATTKDNLPPHDHRVLNVIRDEAQNLEARVLSGLEVTGDLRGPHSAWDFRTAHAAFGSENATYLWTEGIQLVAASDGSTIDIDALHVRSVKHDGTLGFWEVEVAIEHDDPVGHCLQLRDTAGREWAAVLPKIDLDIQPAYRIQFGLSRIASGPRPLNRLTVGIVDEGTLTSSLVSDLWRVFTYGGPGRTLMMIESMLANRMEELTATPFATVLAGLIAFHLREDDLAAVCGGVAAESSKLTEAVRSDFSALTLAVGTRKYGREEYLAPYVWAQGIPTTRLGTIAAAAAAREIMSGTSRIVSGQARTLMRAALKRLGRAEAGLARGTLFTSFVDTTGVEVAAALRALAVPEGGHAIGLDMLAITMAVSSEPLSGLRMRWPAVTQREGTVALGRDDDDLQEGAVARG
jgi:hypothetical protein